MVHPRISTRVQVGTHAGTRASVIAFAVNDFLLDVFAGIVGHAFRVVKLDARARGQRPSLSGFERNTVSVVKDIEY